MVLFERQKLISVLLLVALVVVPVYVGRAATVTNTKDVMSRLKAATASNHEITFLAPNGLALNQMMSLYFAGFSVPGALDADDVDVATGSSADCANATYTEQTVANGAGGASTWGFAQAGDGETIELYAPTSGSGALAANRCLRIRIGTNAVTGATGAEQIVNSVAGAQYVYISVNGSADTGTTLVYLLADDQVAINATVVQSISFSISDNTIGFGDLTTANVRYANGATTGSNSPAVAHDLQAATNASGGYVITVQGATLASGTSTIDAIGGSNTASSAGTEQFGVRFDASGGSGTVTAPYAASGYAYAATATTTSEIASAAGPSLNTTYNATYIANIAPTTSAGAYTTALTYVATATY